ncbi:MAG: OB-fold nucleic acid binding domain-containing protein, partial [Angelakisella sp.]
MQRTELKDLFSAVNNYIDSQVTVGGWVKTIRDSKSIGFIELNDGTSFRNLQIVFEDSKLSNFAEIARQNVGAALIIQGNLVLTPNNKQPFELHAAEIMVEGASSPDFPLQKKKHSLEYLRT